MKKCPFTRLMLLFSGKKPQTRNPYYDDLVGIDHLRKAVEAGVLTNDVNEKLFYLPHQIIELCWMNTEHIVDGLANHFSQGTLTKSIFMDGIEKVVQLFRFVNHTLGLMSKVLSPTEFMAFRGKLSPASGFQSGYHKMELVLTESDFLLHRTATESKCLYWKKGSVDACALSDMEQRQQITKFAWRWQSRNLAHLYLNTSILKEDAEVSEALKKVGQLFGEGFKHAHLSIVNLFLADVALGTAGSEFRTYLPESARVMLYPFLA